MGASGVTPAMVRLFYQTSLSDTALDMLIASAESILANHIGPLAGTVSQSFIGSEIFSLVLARVPDSTTLLLEQGSPSAAIPVDDWAIGTDIRRLLNTTDTGWNEPVVVQYTPDDLELVQMSVIDLVMVQAMTSQTGGYKKERLGEYTYELWTPTEQKATLRAIYQRFAYQGYGPAYTTKLIPVGAADA